MVGFSKIICSSANPKISFYWLHAENVSHFHMLICCAGTDSLSNYITSQTCSHFSSLQHISKQRIPGLSDDLIKNGKDFILIRNPLSILPSFDKVVPLSFLELGLRDLVSIYSELCELGKPPAVIDASELQENPEARKDATQVVANLQRQEVQSRLIACDYLEANIELFHPVSIYMSYLYMLIQTFYTSDDQSRYSFFIDAGDEELV